MPTISPTFSLMLTFGNFAHLNVYNPSHLFIMLMFWQVGVMRMYQGFLNGLWEASLFHSVSVSPGFWHLLVMFIPGMCQVNLGNGQNISLGTYFGCIQFYESLILQFPEFVSGMRWLCLAECRFRFVTEGWGNIHTSAGRQKLSQGNC